jgi:hypothetical protein
VEIRTSMLTLIMRPHRSPDNLTPEECAWQCPTTRYKHNHMDLPLTLSEECARVGQAGTVKTEAYLVNPCFNKLIRLASVSSSGFPKRKPWTISVPRDWLICNSFSVSMPSAMIPSLE